MNRLVISTVVSIVTMLLAHGAPAAEPVKIMTFNIRYGTAPDGENAWPHRREMVIETIQDADPDLLGLQEPQRGQLDVLDEALVDYIRIGVGREADGGGEYSAIYFRQNRFDLQAAGTFWLSGTPETPGSATWGNTLPRIATWVRLLDRTSGERLLYVNTHWDHQSQPAREQSAVLMSERIEQLADGAAVVVTGDFNASPDNPAIRALVEQGDLRDSFMIAHPDETRLDTFNGFGKSRMGAKIDYVFIDDQWDVKDAEIIRTQRDGRYPSDHFPVTATLVLRDAASEE